MDLKLENMVAMITGASQGIGFETALLFAKEGARVALVARREEVLQQAGNVIATQTGHHPLLIVADVATSDGPAEAVRRVIETYGQLDILVNNAGSGASGSFLDADDALWQADFDLKLFGAVRCIRASLPHLEKSQAASIINVTTVSGKAPPANTLPTSVTRAAGIALTKSLANEVGIKGIRVNTVCLGRVRSAQVERHWQREAPELNWEAYSAQQGQTVPLGHLGEASDVANSIVFLSSPRAGYITGASLNVDGGRGATV